MKSEYIKHLESDSEIFSYIKAFIKKRDLKKYFDSKKVELVFSISTSDENNKIDWEELIYKTPQNFYVQCNKISDEQSDSSVTIYYRANQNNELKFYLNQLYKN